MRIFVPNMLKKIDYYIIKKFLGTYALSIVLVISIAIVIDITEKMDDFYREGLDMKTIIFDYYLYFIPYYINLFAFYVYCRYICYLQTSLQLRNYCHASRGD